MRIHNHFVKVLFPFHFSGNGSDGLKKATMKNRSGKEIPVFKQFWFDNTGFRNGLSELFGKKGNAPGIVECFELEYDRRVAFGLPQRKEEPLRFFCREKKDGDGYEVLIAGIRLYLFESGIGFIELEVSYLSDTLKDYMDCNYFLCEVKTDDNYFISSAKKWNEVKKENEISEIRFSVKELLGKVLRHVSGAKNFYSEGPWENTHEKGILFSYLYLDKDQEELQEILFNIWNNYKESYKAPKEGQDSHVRQMFQNSYWCASYNATVNVSVETDDEKTNKFFDTSFASYLRKHYYILFLIVLHQRFSLIQMLSNLDELDKFELSYDSMKEQLRKAQEFQTEAIKHRLRNFYKLPSYTEHINEYYNFISEVFCVDELYTALSTDLDNLERVCSVYVERITTREEQNKRYRTAKIEIFAGLFGLFVGAINLFNDAWQLLERVLGKGTEFFSVLVIFVTLFLWIPSVFVLINSAKKIREMKMIKNEIIEAEGAKEKKKGKKNK